MPQHEVEITISKTGQVKVHVKGVKGKGCVEYAQWLAQAVGHIKEQKLTSEYYEPETKSRIDLKQDLRVQE